ncbi:hypothetical protein BJV78DRAFT_1130076 [Lactifluus subvellereus]|nr:hypothetical protein BJV78DRAFT_1130076 [Lactifluus subvellereus]
MIHDFAGLSTGLDTVVLWKPKFLLPQYPFNGLASIVHDLQLDYLTENNAVTLILPGTAVEVYYADPPPPEYIHVIAQLIGQPTVRPHDTATTGTTVCGHDSEHRRYSTLPHTHVVSVIARNAAVNAAREALPPPSVSKKPSDYRAQQNACPIYNGRPAALTGPSVGLYSKAFAQVIDSLNDISGANPTPEQVATTGKFMHDASTIYPNEDARQSMTFTYLEKLLGVSIQSQVKLEGKVTGDGVSFTPLGTREWAVAVYYEMKAELGSGDPGLQAALTYRKHVAQDSYRDIRNASCCPCLIIAIPGPYICFMGGVFAHVPIVQPFTPYLYLGGHPFTREHVAYTARVFHVVAEAIHTLVDEYTKVRTRREIETPEAACLLPYSSFGVNYNGVDLVYHERLPGASGVEDDPGRAMFRATLGTMDVVVKFCETYCADAHMLLAEHKFAPRLYHFGRVSGGLCMVVMELVSGSNAYHRFRAKDQYKENPLPAHVRNDIRDAVKLLHENGLVFGDLRRPNIMVVSRETVTGTARQGGMLVDFDWAGVDGSARYPPIINDSGEIRWASGIKAGGLIEKQHDLDMLELL